MFATRRAAVALSRGARQPIASFHSTRPSFVKVGDAIPDIELVENSPGNKVSLAKELTGKGLIIGTPGAFSRFPIFQSSVPLPRSLFLIGHKSLKKKSHTILPAARSSNWSIGW